MNANVARTGRRGFSLVELIAVIAVMAILAAVAIPKFFNYTGKAKEASVKATLATTRTAIANFYADKAASGTAAYPTLKELRTLGTVLNEGMPANPFNKSETIAKAVFDANNPPTAGKAGWNYDPATGHFWPNTATASVKENTW